MTSAPGDRATAGRNRSMSLLDELTVNALDPGYQQTVDRRVSGAGTADQPGGRRDHPRRYPRRRRGLLVAGLLVAGLLLATAAAQARSRAPASAQVRSSLAADVAARTRDTDALQSQVAQLRVQVAAARGRGLAATRSGTAMAEQVAALEEANGGTPLRGPGLRVTLADATLPTPDPLAATKRPSALPGDAGRIADRDVQDVVNALWAAGAEAISVGGQRLTPQTAIRAAGQAILVDFRPLSPPYDVIALGEQSQLGNRFGDSPTARRFRTYAATYGIGFTIRSERALTVPVGAGPPLRAARPPAPAP